MLKHNIDRIIETINSKTDWDRNVKIRFAYTELGKLLNKNVMFFYTLYGKVPQIALKSSEISEILASDDFVSEVVCKNAAKYLKYIFDRTGISSKIVKTKDPAVYKDDYGEATVNHYFVLATGNNGNKYTLTLASDLANIQLGLETCHFATGVKHTKEDGTLTYYGKRFEDTVMTPEEIRLLDIECGYLNLHLNGFADPVYTDRIFQVFSHERSFKYYQSLLYRSSKNKFYMDLVKLLNSENGETECINVDLFSKSVEDWNFIKRFVCYETLNKLFSDNRLRLSQEQKEKWVILLDSDITLEKITQFYEEFRDYIKKSNIRIPEDILGLGPIAIVHKIKTFVELVTEIQNVSSNNWDRKSSIKSKFRDNIRDISLYFVPGKFMARKSPVLSSEYIAHKIFVMFSSIFDLGRITDFNSMGIGEQSIIIGKVINSILSELKPNFKNPDYNNSISPIENRIVKSVIINKETGDCDYLMYIKSNNMQDDGGVCLIYDLKNNFLRGASSRDEISLIDVFVNYHVVTSKLSIPSESIEKTRAAKRVRKPSSN